MQQTRSEFAQWGQIVAAYTCACDRECVVLRKRRFGSWKSASSFAAFVYLSNRMQIEIKSADRNQVKNVRTSDPEFKAFALRCGAS